MFSFSVFITDRSSVSCIDLDLAVDLLIQIDNVYAPPPTFHEHKSCGIHFYQITNKENCSLDSTLSGRTKILSRKTDSSNRLIYTKCEVTNDLEVSLGEFYVFPWYMTPALLQKSLLKDERKLCQGILITMSSC